jgi:outer membrane protein OmpA-like peptidoglycan-associated protein
MVLAIRHLAVSLILVSLLSCASAPKVPKIPPPNPKKTMDSDSNNAFGLQSIHFPARSFQVVRSERDKLAKNAEILVSHPSIMLEIEGHTDGRGPMGRSLEWAETRAKIVREVLIGLGVPAARMSTIAYGKDRMLDHSGTERGFARNRRVNFLILSY